MEKTIYDICSEILSYTVENLENNFGENLEKVTYELLIFLTTDSSKYDVVFDKYEFIDNKPYYKKIMMLIIASSSYYTSLYCAEKDLNRQMSEMNIEVLENLNYKDIVKMFYNWPKYLKVFDFIEDYCDFYNKSYILKNNCMEEVLKKDKISIIYQINPFEFLNYINYLEPKMLASSEKVIQDFIDIYDASLYYCGIDENNELSFYEDNEDFLASIIRGKIDEKYDRQEFYSYIFSNIYEGFITKYTFDKYLIKKYPIVGKEFLNHNISFERLYNMILNDNNFLFELIDFFLEINDKIYQGELLTRRIDFKKVGNIDTLKRLNPFYEEEEFVYKKRYLN